MHPQSRPSVATDRPPPAARTPVRREEPLVTLQRAVGNQAMARLAHGAALARRGEGEPDGAPAEGRATGEPRSLRERAAELGAPTVDTVLATQMPWIVAHLQPDALARLQHSIDATVVNREVREQRFTATLHQARGLRAPAVDEAVTSNPDDGRVHLDAAGLLPPELFVSESKRPHEVQFLQQVREHLLANGLWLMVENTQRATEAFLSLRPERNSSYILQTDPSGLTQKAVISPGVFATAYVTNVSTVDVRFDQAAAVVRDQIALGRQTHAEIRARHRDAALGVAEASDFLGGADLPDEWLWDVPQSWLQSAFQLWHDKGNPTGAYFALDRAAKAAQSVVDALREYLGDSISGGERAVTVLETAWDVGKVAGTLVLVHYALGGAVRIVAGEAGTEAAGGAAMGEGRRRAAGQLLPGEVPMEGQVGWVPTGRGTVDRGFNF